MSKIAGKLDDTMLDALRILEPGVWPGEAPKFATPEEAMAYAAKLLHDGRAAYHDWKRAPSTLARSATKEDLAVVEAAESAMFVLAKDEDGDGEENHKRADELLASVLEWLGFRALVSDYREVGKWYS
jgi:hypothetical protein